MIDKKKLKIFLFLLYLSSFFGIERKENPRPLAISIIVPCHPNHFPLLEPLFLAYQMQTSLPQEIVVSLSEAFKVSDMAILMIENKEWPFSVKFVKSDHIQAPGKNRNVACSAATGDVIICQDADDLPHPQRVETIRYLFENFEIEHLLHQWLPSDGVFQSFVVQTIEQQCTRFRSYHLIDTPLIHNGSVCFLRSVYEKIHWHPKLTIDEDSIFNRHAYVFFPNHYVLPKQLIRYRGELSTFDLNGDKFCDH